MQQSIIIIAFSSAGLYLITKHGSAIVTNVDSIHGEPCVPQLGLFHLSLNSLRQVKCRQPRQVADLLASNAEQSVLPWRSQC